MFTPMSAARRACSFSALVWLGLLATASAAEPAAGGDMEDVTKMTAYNVKADRVEEFGFRVGGQIFLPWSSGSPIVRAVYPNTAAAKAGLRPGDRVLTTDGRSASVSMFSLGKWRQLHAK